MLRKNLAALLVLFSAIFVFGPAAQAQQETEAATESNLTGVALPAGAQRILPGSMPASLTASFDKIIPPDGPVEKGDLEGLVWMGADYRQADAPAMISRITGALRAAGWQYTVEKDENGVTVFSLLKGGAQRRRVLVGYYGATSEALVLAWVELLPKDGGRSNAGDDYERTQTRDDSEMRQRPAQTSPARNSGGGGSIVGEWTSGYVSRTGFVPQNQPTAPMTPGKSRVWTYVFRPDGTFEFSGLLETTMYSCKSSLFQDKRGRYAIDGDQITLTLTKNFWRKQESCSPSSNRELNHKLDPETYTLTVKRNEYGNEEVCLSGAETGTNACFQRKKD